MISYNSLWSLKRDGSSWYDQGLLHSGETSLPEAKDAVVKRLMESGFKGCIAFREPAQRDAKVDCLHLYKISDNTHSHDILLEKLDGLDKVYDELVDQTELKHVLDNHKITTSF